MKIKYIARKGSKLPNGDPESIHWGNEFFLRAIKQTKRTTTWFGVYGEQSVKEYIPNSCEIGVTLHRNNGSVKDGGDFTCTIEVYGLKTSEILMCCDMWEITCLLNSCMAGLKGLYEDGLNIVADAFDHLGCVG